MYSSRGGPSTTLHFFRSLCLLYTGKRRANPAKKKKKKKGGWGIERSDSYQVQIEDGDDEGNRMAEIAFAEQPEHQHHNAHMVYQCNLCYVHFSVPLFNYNSWLQAKYPSTAITTPTAKLSSLPKRDSNETIPTASLETRGLWFVVQRTKSNPKARKE